MLDRLGKLRAIIFAAALDFHEISQMRPMATIGIVMHGGLLRFQTQAAQPLPLGEHALVLCRSAASDRSSDSHCLKLPTMWGSIWAPQAYQFPLAHRESLALRPWR